MNIVNTNSKEFRIVATTTRDWDILKKFITKLVPLGNKIVTDSWAVYDFLNNNGYVRYEHNHGEGEAEEYGISTFVYTSRKPFDVAKFEKYINEAFPKTVIRCKGLVWFKSDYDMSYLFEQAGKQFKVSETGYWLASAPKEDLEEIVKNEPDALKDWDDEVGDRMIKLVFIGKNMDKQQIIDDLEKLK